MKNKDTTSEKAILEAAEQVFLNKGYAAARTTEIAKIAGVNHAMLHYYFGSKEELFNKVFSAKLQTFVSSVTFAFDKTLPFIEKIKFAVEAHFDFLVANPRLPLFLVNELLMSPEKLEIMKSVMFPKVLPVVERIVGELNSEAEKGVIKKLSFLDLLFSLATQNITSVIAAEVLYNNDIQAKSEFLEHRKTTIIEFLLNSLKV